MRLIEKVWFQQHHSKWILLPLLLPLTLIFSLLSALRRFFYRVNIFKAYRVSKPVIVVGNIGIGGNGKTPVVVFLVEQCRLRGLTPGVISRGYGGKAPHYPYFLNESSTAKEAGDEPILVYQRCQVPVAVGADRIANANLLIEQGCDVIIADDGLQHYALARDIELIIVDGIRRFGNRLLLPAGPLREGLWRLNKVDHVIINGRSHNDLDQSLGIKGLTEIGMQLTPQSVCHLITGESIALASFKEKYPKVNAMAGIGDPNRFFNTLKEQNFQLEKSIGFVDHHGFTQSDLLPFSSGNSELLPLLMTEKDAVKCQGFAEEHWWYVPVSTDITKEQSDKLMTEIYQKIKLFKAPIA
jgi:tetraacyldisaccharide 4'-kinase